MPLSILPHFKHVFTPLEQLLLPSCLLMLWPVFASAQPEAMQAYLNRSDFGETLEAGAGNCQVWWCSSGWKIGRDRPAPKTAGAGLRLSGASNEAEAVQVVLHPGQPLKNLLWTAEALKSATGDSLPAAAIEVLRVGYVKIERATDVTGVAGEWPDPLPPLHPGLTLEPDKNHPFWVRVTIPKGTQAGAYRGVLQFAADDVLGRVPLEVQVWDFALPDTPTCTSAFGFSPGAAFQYHGATTDTDQRAVLELYWKSFSAHHITPYDPAPLDNFRVQWPDAPKDLPLEALKPEIDWKAWDAAMERAFDSGHFTSFMLPSVGLGSGTFHSRVEPELLGYPEGTPEYQQLFTQYWSAVEKHLREKQWLSRAYVYWFDEPDPKDYDFVNNGFRKLKDAAPGIPRMLTEQPESGLLGGPTIWCPITPEFKLEEASVRMSQGETFWWYVCTGPKAPYATLFIDQPATALRAWLWQTWERGISGILVWQSNYWHSPEAYPDALQNPYTDPMSWMTSYSTQPGQQIPWGNGDGRFLYPPEAASGVPLSKPNLEPPVDSVRWEMLRDGIEDYEYLAILRSLLDSNNAVRSAGEAAQYRALLDFPSAITQDMTSFSEDPGPIEAHRARLAAAIETLSRP